MMKAYSKLLVLLLLAVSLTACGGGNNAANSGNNDVNEPGSVLPDPSTNDGDDHAGGKQEQAEPAEETPAEPPAPTRVVEVEVEGMIDQRTGVLSESDNGYYMYTIPPFIFTPEEPGVDQVYIESYPDYFLRIQALPDDVDLAQIRANAEEELRAVNEAFEERKGDEIYDAYLRGSEFYLIAVGDDIVKSIIVMNIDGKLFKFTMFMPVGGEASEGAESGFNAMIKTITPTVSSK